ncbi:S8 family serine peptidase [Flavobacterium sp. H122]|uniref:S8 family serine peptidase n=1 Tax=Flavobacterium sp. H122 TaxID=2529860 RepID=UPI0010AB3DD1|nr:S8 family serine peptidase [Flavobacterium sp. H122]
MKKITLLLLLFNCYIFSQSNKDRKELIKQTNTNYLSVFSAKKKAEDILQKDNIKKFAAKNNLPLVISNDSIFSELVEIDKNNVPLYYSTFNHGAGITTRANELYTGGSLGLNIEGQNMIVGVWDAGSAYPQHELFEGRLTVKDNSSKTHYHSAHVAGTLIGSDKFQSGHARGMAFKANANSYDWNSDVYEIAQAASEGLLISNHSYGLNPSLLPLSYFGKYIEKSMYIDDILYNAPYFQYVCSAGNTRNNGINTAKNGFDLLTDHAVSKNAIVVAATEEVLNYTGSNSVLMSDFSSWGPTDDGRIKPDISAKGVNTFSAMNTQASYNYLSGTSMASPSVAGTLTLLQQYHNQVNGKFMKASTLRGLTIHTADEAGPAPGPDYMFGWGLLNAKKAALLIKNNKISSEIQELKLSQGQTFTKQIKAIENEPLKVTVCWTDPKGLVSSTTIDDSTPSLVNDLDIKLVKNNSTTFEPWLLDPKNPNSPAKKGDNIVDNVEKIEILNPTGSYSLVITHKGTLVNNSQDFSLIISGVRQSDFWITAPDSKMNICENSINSIEKNFSLKTFKDKAGLYLLSVLDAPKALDCELKTKIRLSPGNFKLKINGLNKLTAGEHFIIIRAKSKDEYYDFYYNITVTSNNLSKPILTSPINNQNDTPINQVFNWEKVGGANSYIFELSTDNTFKTNVTRSTTDTNSTTITGLSPNTQYFWKVTAKNNCTESVNNTTFTFKTICPVPTNVTVGEITRNSAHINWGNNTVNSWEYFLVAKGATPITGTITNSNSLTLTNLVSNTCYDFYLKTNCGTTKSQMAGPFSFCTLADYCNGDHFYDTGGINGYYKDGERYTKTITPERSGDRIKAIFHQLQLENCCDYLTIYNGPDTNSSILFRSNGTLPTNIKSTHPSGALTFLFTSDGSGTGSGWDASIICEPIPACPNPPSNITSLELRSTDTTINWTENNSSTSWEYYLVPQNTPITSLPAATVTNSNTLRLENLTQNTCYSFYVKSVCNGGYSELVGPYNFCTPVNYCESGKFYDTGGPNGNYQNAEYYTKTIYPNTSGDRIKVIFESFNLETCCDRLTIYNGPNTSNPILYNGSSISPGTLASTHTSGALTFTFTSDGSVVGTGWNATVICEPMPPCPNSPSNLTSSNITINSATINWNENGDSTSWEYFLVPSGTSPTGQGTVTTQKPLTLTDLTSNTNYDFYIKSICSNGNSAFSNVLSFKTLADYCGGDHFYDTGGANGNYKGYENYTTTIHPNAAGERIRATFNTFQLDGCCDILTIFDGTDTNAPIIFNGSAAIAPWTATATNPQGALTFRFISNYATENSGWDATIICEPFPPCTFAPIVSTSTPTSNSITINWINNSNTSQWEYFLMERGVPIGTTGTLTSNNTVLLDNLAQNTCYDFHIRAKCNDNINSPFTVINFCTAIDYCIEGRFYDSGGPNGNYKNIEHSVKTIYPNNGSQKVAVVFNSFSTEACCDYLRIYNGPTTSHPLLYNAYGANYPSAKLISTDITGALTFEFHSDGSVISSGWDATITCETVTPANDNVTNKSVSNTMIEDISVFPNPFTDKVNINSKNAISNYVLYDINFREIDFNKINSSSFELNLSKLPQGLYLIKLTTKEGSSSIKKIIKK